jgi:hypothetical protein
MKAKYIILFVIILLSLFIYKIMVREDRKSMTITDFTKSHALTVIPINNFYEVCDTKITGYVNDTVIIRVSTKEVKLTGNINYSTFSNYLGNRDPNSVYIIPYKATKGKLKVKHGYY